MGLLQDVKFGLRMMGKNCGFTLIAISILAMGIGVNSLVFTLANGILSAQLPFHDAQEIMLIQYERGLVSYPDFLDYRTRSQSFKGIAALSPFPSDLSGQESNAEHVAGAWISTNLFSLLGQKPVLGRDFTSDDEKAGATPSALLSFGLWQTRYGGKADIIGGTIRVNLQPYTVVGVMPTGEAFPQDTKLWLAITQSPSRLAGEQHDLSMIGRLGEHTSVEQARAEWKTMAGNLAERDPDASKD